MQLNFFESNTSLVENKFLVFHKQTKINKANGKFFEVKREGQIDRERQGGRNLKVTFYGGEHVPWKIIEQLNLKR